MMKMLNQVVLSLFVLQIVSAQVQLQPKPLNGTRNEILVVTCTFGSNMIELRLGGDNIMSLSKFINVTVIGNNAVYRYGPLEDTDGGSVFTCDDLDASTDSATLDVLYAPELSVQPNVVESSLTGTAIFNYTVEANPSPPSPPVVFKDGEQFVERIDVSNTSITFSNIQCRDNGTYTLQSTNTVGSGNVTFSLLVTRSVPIWTVNNIFADSNLISLSKVAIACPEEILSVSCVFSNYSVPGVQFTTTFNAGDMTLELSMTPATVSGNTVTVTANAICTASNQEGATQSRMSTVGRTISGTSPTPALGPGEIAGIAVGSIAGVIIIVGIVIAIIIGICCCLKKR